MRSRPVPTEYRKHGPTPPSFDNPHFYTLPGAAFGTTQIPAGSGPIVTTVMFTLTNGQLGDDTPAGDGMIIEPGGPAALILASAVPVASMHGVVVLIALLTAVAFLGARRQANGESARRVTSGTPG